MESNKIIRQTKCQWSSTSKTKTNKIIIIFGGCFLRVGGIPPFEFRNTMNKRYPEYDVHIFVDTNQAWYHKGLPNIGKNIDDVINYIDKITKDYSEIKFMGNSMGGYASILFATAIKGINPQKRISSLSFSPQTNITKLCKVASIYSDLSKVIREDVEYFIHYSTYFDKNDTYHGDTHLNNLLDLKFSNVNHLTEYRTDGNIKIMRDNGTLYKILDDYFVSDQ